MMHKTGWIILMHIAVFLMLISPWVKRDHVSHMHYSFGSLFKTFWNILGLPYLNQYDAGANDLSDFFTQYARFQAYTCCGC